MRRRTVAFGLGMVVSENFPLGSSAAANKGCSDRLSERRRPRQQGLSHRGVPPRAERAWIHRGKKYYHRVSVRERLSRNGYPSWRETLSVSRSTLSLREARPQRRPLRTRRRRSRLLQAVTILLAGVCRRLTATGWKHHRTDQPYLELVGKRLELLKEVIPQLSRVAVLWNPSNPRVRTLEKRPRLPLNPWACSSRPQRYEIETI